MTSSVKFISRGVIYGFIVFALTTLSGCSMHSEDVLKSKLNLRYPVGETFYFKSQMTCSFAVFRALDNMPKPHVTLFSNVDEAQESFRTHGRAALHMPGETPHQLVDFLLMNDDGAMGKQALAAAAQTGECLDETQSRAFRRALTRPEGVLAYDIDIGGMIVIDPLERKLFFAAGDQF